MLHLRYLRSDFLDTNTAELMPFLADENAAALSAFHAAWVACWAILVGRFGIIDHSVSPSIPSEYIGAACEDHPCRLEAQPSSEIAFAMTSAIGRDGIKKRYPHGLSSSTP
jgi:hypothetical protein